jgi:hypothetical protein
MLLEIGAKFKLTNDLIITLPKLVEFQHLAFPILLLALIQTLSFDNVARFR